jgi:DNA-binding GntR family transcriptional regulator
LAKSPKEACFEDMRLRILRTDLAPGTLLDEVSLAQRYGLSRTPLREILQRLAGGGYITLAEHRGAKVASMDILTLRVFFQTAPLVYGSISRLAAENRTEAQLLDLQRAQNDFAKCIRNNDTAATALANHRFHALIGDMAQNPYLAASLDRLLIDHTRLSQTFYRPKSVEDEARVMRACAQHNDMIAAIADRDADRAVTLTLEHWDLSRDRMERFVKPDPLPFDPQESKEHTRAI